MVMVKLFESICFRNKNWNIYRGNDMGSRINLQIFEKEEVNLCVDETILTED